MARTDNLTIFLEDVATSIKEKKKDNMPIKASEFDTEIANLSGGGDVSEYFTEKINSTGTNGVNSGWINTIKKIPALTFNGVSTQYIFNYCPASSIDLSNFDTSQVTNMQGTFSRTAFKTIDLSNFDTSNVANMGNMFEYNSQLISLDLSNFNTSKVTNTGYMCQYCSSLSKLIIDNPNIFPMTSISMLQQTAIAQKKGYIYVPDDLVESYKSATNWSAYASQIKPISELPNEEV